MTPGDPRSEPAPTVVLDVTVVDPRDGTTQEHVDVHLAGGRVTRLASTSPGSRSDAAKTVDGRGRWLVPGFVDMHAHPLTSPDPGPALRLMLAHGITGYRQMSGSAGLLRQRREGTLPCARHAPALLSLCGAILTPLNAGSEQAGRTAVRDQHAAGADFVKAAMCPAEVLPAVQAEARDLGIPVLGHLPAGLPVREVSQAGFRSIEHLGPGVGVLAACSAREGELAVHARPGRSMPPAVLAVSRLLGPVLERAVARVVARVVVNPLQRVAAADLADLELAVETFDETKARALARQFVGDGTWHCPTLIRVRTQEQCDHHDFHEDPDLRFIASSVRRTWVRAADRFAERFSAREHQLFDDLYLLQLRLVRILDEEGVGLLAGSDAVGAGWVVPGASLHRELDELARAGLSAARLLRMVTWDAARFLGLEERLGTVSAGKAADLVLLGGDPTTATAHLHDVRAVARAGHWYDAAALEALKDDVAQRPVR